MFSPCAAGYSARVRAAGDRSLIQDTRQLFTRARHFRRWRSLPQAARDAWQRDFGGPRSDPGIERSVLAATAWLERAQKNSRSADGGVAAHYSLLDGWGHSYPETTGYIVPTMFAQADRLASDTYAKSAQEMLDWLLRIQLPGGGFQGGFVNDEPVVPVTFNTGQILMGLADGTMRFGEPYRSATIRAADWLTECQDPDGCWRQNTSPFARPGERAYKTHTAWGLLEAARACESEKYADAALRNIHWALGKMRPNGWFSDCCLTDPTQPLTHTLGYALRGIIEGYRFNGDERLLEAAITSANGLMTAQRDDGWIPGRLDHRLRGTVPWTCLTGDVQIAHCWLLLFQITNDRRYADAARAANAYVRRTVDVDGPPETTGAVAGSFPIAGDYGQFRYLNWAAKFFIDANVLERDLLGG